MGPSIHVAMCGCLGALPQTHLDQFRGQKNTWSGSRFLGARVLFVGWFEVKNEKGTHSVEPPFFSQSLGKCAKFGATSMQLGKTLIQ